MCVCVCNEDINQYLWVPLQLILTTKLQDFFGGGGGLVGGIPAQSPEFESPDGLATFLWNNR